MAPRTQSPENQARGSGSSERASGLESERQDWQSPIDKVSVISQGEEGESEDGM
jgi:hypothetical protein